MVELFGDQVRANQSEEKKANDRKHAEAALLAAKAQMEAATASTKASQAAQAQAEAFVLASKAQAEQGKATQAVLMEMMRMLAEKNK